MADYIKREDAIEAITDLIRARLNWRVGGNEERQGLNAAMCAIEDVDAADVVERKRGKWARKWDHRNGFDYAYEECSVCGAPVNVCGYDYCPNCGAEMESADDV